VKQKPTLLAALTLVGLLAPLLAAAALGTARAQSSEEIWGEPVNLSRSGGASEPQIVAHWEGLVQVFWWDQFDGLMTAYREEGTWTDRAPAPIILSEVVGEGRTAEVVRTPIAAMPTIFAGSDHAHALWLGPADEETGLQPLLHSRLALGTTTWSDPQTVAETARVWRLTAAPDGTLHLIYLRPVHTEEAAAGVYYQRSTNAGVSWGGAEPIYQTIYFRLVEAEEAHLSLTADDDGHVYAAWDDPRREETLLVISADGGDSWLAPQILSPDRGARRARVTPTDEEPLLLWEETGVAAGCSLHQQRVSMPITPTLVTSQTVTLSEPEPVLEELRACPQDPAFYRRVAGGPLMIAADQGLTASAWNGEQWAEPRSLAFSFEHPELGRQVYPEELHTALVGDRLAVVGVGQGGDIWYVESAVDAWDWVFAPPPPWSEPSSIAQAAGLTGRPALVVDADGRLHALWGDPDPGVGVESARQQAAAGALTYARLEASAATATSGDGPQWSRPAQVLESPEGAAVQPALVTHGDRLLALWSGGEAGTIYLSRAFVRDAYAPGGWSEPVDLPMGGVTASSPAALVDANGLLHVVYAAPLNEGRGIYYLRSDPASADGQNGGPRIDPEAEPRLIFDAEAAGFGAVDHPSLALDPAGTLHVAWVRGSSGGPFPPRAVLHAQSGDGGLTWSQAKTLAEGAYDWPLVAAPVPGEVHVLWSQVEGGSGWTHRWSLDYGQTWTYQQQVRGFRDVPGPAALSADGAGDLHLVGLGRDDEDAPALAYTIWRWEDERWEQQDPFRVEGALDIYPGLAAALQSTEGRLDVAFRARVPVDSDDGRGTSPSVLHARRTVPVVTEEQEPVYTPVPTVTPTPSPTPLPTATPRPAVQPEPPPAGPPIVGFGPITLPLIAIGGLGLALVIIVGVLVTRSQRRR